MIRIAGIDARIRLLISAVALIPSFSLVAQLYSAQNELRGGGVLQTCDTSMHVSISTTLLDGYGCSFQAVIDPGATEGQDLVWSYYNGALEQVFGNPMQLYYGGSQQYPICVTVNAYDLVAQQPCSTTVCDLVTPVPDLSCVSLAADFTIGSVSGNTITFQDLTTFDGTVQQTLWSFGDGQSIATTTPSHTFEGPGPFEICLTAIGPPPSYCVSTICQWLYLGPGGVECPVLVDQGFFLFQTGSLVGVLDTSRTSGMFRSVSWDFGDGALAQGVVAVHEYTSPGVFPVCGTLRVWGPLLNDTCVTNLCETIFASPSTGVQSAANTPHWSAYPDPFHDHLAIVGPEIGGAAVSVHDAVGRVVTHPAPATEAGTLRLDLSSLSSGHYLLRVRTRQGVWTTSLIKE